MEAVVLVVHLILALAIIGLVLLQRSEGGGLGIGGGGLGGLASPRGAANVLTRATAICAAGFFCTSLALGVLAGQHSAAKGILSNLQTPVAVVEGPAEAEGEATREPEAPPSDEAPSDEAPSDEAPSEAPPSDEAPTNAQEAPVTAPVADE